MCTRGNNMILIRDKIFDQCTYIFDLYKCISLFSMRRAREIGFFSIGAREIFQLKTKFSKRYFFMTERVTPLINLSHRRPTNTICTLSNRKKKKLFIKTSK